MAFVRARVLLIGFILHLVFGVSGLALPTGPAQLDFTHQLNDSYSETAPSANIEWRAASIVRRECTLMADGRTFTCDWNMPTVEQMKARMRQGMGTADHHVVFYTNLKDPALQKGVDPEAAWLVGWWKARKDDKYYWVANASSIQWYNTQFEHIKKFESVFERAGHKDPVETFQKCYYQAMAFNAQNPDAYVFTPRDKEWKEDSLWRMIELPTLLYNQNVKRIWRVDPRPPDVKGIKEGDVDYCNHDQPQLLYDRDDPKYQEFRTKTQLKWSFQNSSSVIASNANTVLEEVFLPPSNSNRDEINKTIPEHSFDRTYDFDHGGERKLQQFFDSILTKRNHSTHIFDRRGCEFKLSSGRWECDDDIPTMSALVAQMRDKPGGTANRGRHAAFYVNLVDDPALSKDGNNEEAKLVGWCNKNNLRNKYYWWANCVDKYWLEAQAKHLKENRARIEKAHPEWQNPEQIFLKGVFQAMAFAAQNPTVLFFTPKGKDWKENTIWQEVEYPTLTRNKNVKEIVRIDPNCPDNKPELMWSRQRRDPMPPVVFKYPDMR